MVTGADAAAVDAVIGAWLARQSAARESDTDPSALVAIAVDGKTVRGATDTEGNQVHLLAAATHTDALVLGQVEVGAKTNEIPMFAPLLDRLADTGVDLAQTVITADALCRLPDYAERESGRAGQQGLRRVGGRHNPGL